MKYIVVSIRDRGTDLYSQPMCVAARGQAIRAFGDEVNSKNESSQVSKHPEDFDLYELGTFDDRTGMFETGVPVMIAVGKDLKA